MPPVEEFGSELALCVLAHNEEAVIERTLRRLLEPPGDFPVIVYANGCTDRTAEIVSRLAGVFPRLSLRTLEKASKPGAWNCAFREQHREFIVFSDGDVLPDAGAALHLVAELRRTPASIMATCRQVPLTGGLSLEQRVVGFMQMPLVQDFLAGGFYAVRKAALAATLERHGHQGLPPGIAGEDAFLDAVAGGDTLVVSEALSRYVPPDFRDYRRYLARIRWQNQQIRLLLNAQPVSGMAKLRRKFARSRNPIRLLSGGAATVLKRLFCRFFAADIDRVYRDLGPVQREGAAILSGATRADSTRRSSG